MDTETVTEGLEPGFKFRIANLTHMAALVAVRRVNPDAEPEDMQVVNVCVAVRKYIGYLADEGPTARQARLLDEIAESCCHGAPWRTGMGGASPYGQEPVETPGAPRVEIIMSDADEDEYVEPDAISWGVGEPLYDIGEALRRIEDPAIREEWWPKIKST